MPFEQLLQRLKAEVERHGVTKTAQATGISPASLSRIIRGQQWPARNVLEKLLNYFGIAFDVADLPSRAFQRSPTILGSIEPPDFYPIPTVPAALADGLETAFTVRYGRRIPVDEPISTVYALVGSVNESRIVVSDEDGVTELRSGTPQEGEDFVRLLAAQVALRPRRLTCGPVYTLATAWPPNSPQGESLAAALLGRLLADGLDAMLAQEFSRLPTVEVATNDPATIATAIAQNADARLFARDQDGKPRGLLVASAATIDAWASAADGVRTIELGHGQLGGLELAVLDLPETDTFAPVAIAIARDRLVYRLDSVEAIWDFEPQAGFNLIGVRITCRADCRLLLTDDEKLGFALVLGQS